MFLIIFIKKSSEKSCLQQQCTYCQKSKAFSTHSQEKIGFRYTTKWFGSHIGTSQKEINAVKNTWIFSPAHTGEDRWFCAPKHTTWLEKVSLGHSLLLMQHNWSDGSMGLGFPHPPPARDLLGAQPTRASPRPQHFSGAVIWSVFSASSLSNPSVRLNPRAHGGTPGVEELNREGRCYGAGAMCLPHVSGRRWAGGVRFLTCQAISSLRGENQCGSFKPWAERGRERPPFAKWRRVN